MRDALLSEFAHLRRVLINPVAVWFAAACAFIGVPLPWLNGSVSEYTIGRVEYDLVPQGISVVSLTPMDPFLAQTSMAAMLAFFLAMPLLAYELWRYVSPGLYPHERRGLALFLVCSFVLLGVGAAFAYWFLIPAVFKGLYAFSSTGVTSFYSLQGLIALVCGMVVSVSLMFLLPLAMILLTFVGLVPAAFWRQHARYAVLLALIMSAIITPDGTGISMALLAVPICLLYGTGYAGSTLSSRSRQRAIIKHSN